MLRIVTSILFVAGCVFIIDAYFGAKTSLEGYTASANTDDVIKLIYNLGMAFMFSLGNISILLIQILSNLNAVKKESVIEEY